MYGVEGDISTITRLGSGSACRSMYGDVKWAMDSKDDGSDSIAIQVQPETHWPDINIIVLVVNDKKKETGLPNAPATTIIIASGNTERIGNTRFKH